MNIFRIIALDDGGSIMGKNLLFASIMIGVDKVDEHVAFFGLIMGIHNCGLVLWALHMDNMNNNNMYQPKKRRLAVLNKSNEIFTEVERLKMSMYRNKDMHAGYEAAGLSRYMNIIQFIYLVFGWHIL
ncbi:hypothetical protein ACJX0J_016680, partial [Zea mays]